MHQAAAHQGRACLARHPALEGEALRVFGAGSVVDAAHPSFQMFAFTYNSTAQHPFGNNWTLSPEHLGTKNYYIGYSIDDVCPKVIEPAVQLPCESLC